MGLMVKETILEDMLTDKEKNQTVIGDLTPRSCQANKTPLSILNYVVLFICYRSKKLNKDKNTTLASASVVSKLPYQNHRYGLEIIIFFKALKGKSLERVSGSIIVLISKVNRL